MGSCQVTELMNGAEPPLVTAYALIEIDRVNGHRKVEEVSPFFSERAAVFDWMIRDHEGEPEIKRKVKKAMVENRVRVVDRKVKEEDVEA